MKEKLNNKKLWDLIGLVLGLVILVMGIVFMLTPPETYSTDSTDYASFGADFYTYQYKATRAVAHNTAVTANNLRELGAAQAAHFGFLFVTIGALTALNYGKRYFTEYVEEAPKAEEADPVQAEQAAQE